MTPTPMTDTRSAPPPPDPTRWYGARIGLFYAAMFLVMGTVLPYLNVWLEWRGLSLAEIAIVATVSPLVRLVAGPALSFLADRHQAHRSVVIGSAWLGFLAWYLLSQVSSFWSILIACALVSITGSALMPLVETLAMAGVRAWTLDYGRMRLWGSVSFIAVSIAGGWLIDFYGVQAAMWMLVTGAFLTAIAAHYLPVAPQSVDAAGPRRALQVDDALALVRSPAIMTFLLAAGAVQGAHAVFYVFGVLHWRAQGISNGWCGALWSIAVIAEIVLFWMGGRWFKAIGPIEIMMIGAIAAIVRWFAMAFDPPLMLLVALQLLHALTYAATHLGAMQFLARAVPAEQSGTAQGVYALVTGGLAMALANQIAGLAYLSAQSRAYLVMVGVSIIALAALALLKRRWNGGLVAPRQEA